MKKLKLNKIKISNINNLNTIIGGGDGTYQEATLWGHTCDPVRCTITTTTNTDTTDGEVTGKPVNNLFTTN